MRIARYSATLPLYQSIKNMKNIYSILILSLVIGLLVSSCSDDCCNSGVNKVCEGDAECTGQGDWDSCKTYLTGLGYTCN